MKAFERRDAIIDILLARSSETIRQLAVEFAVNEKTIRRDIDELSLSYPIRIECGRYTGGVYIDPTYRTRRKYLKPEETELLKRLSSELKGNDAEILQGILKQFSFSK